MSALDHNNSNIGSHYHVKEQLLDSSTGSAVVIGSAVAVSDSSSDPTYIAASSAADLLTRTVTLPAGSYMAIASWINVTTLATNQYGTVELMKDGTQIGPTTWASADNGNYPNSGDRQYIVAIFSHAGGSTTFKIHWAASAGALNFGVSGGDVRFGRQLDIVRIGS